MSSNVLSVRPSQQVSFSHCGLHLKILPSRTLRPDHHNHCRMDFAPDGPMSAEGQKSLEYLPEHPDPQTGTLLMRYGKARYPSQSAAAVPVSQTDHAQYSSNSAKLHENRQPVLPPELPRTAGKPMTANSQANRPTIQEHNAKKITQITKWATRARNDLRPEDTSRPLSSHHIDSLEDDLSDQEDLSYTAAEDDLEASEDDFSEQYAMDREELMSLNDMKKDCSDHPEKLHNPENGMEDFINDEPEDETENKCRTEGIPKVGFAKATTIPQQRTIAAEPSPPTASCTRETHHKASEFVQSEPQDASCEISEYELQRQRNIAKNQALLSELKLKFLSSRFAPKVKVQTKKDHKRKLIDLEPIRKSVRIQKRVAAQGQQEASPGMDSKKVIVSKAKDPDQRIKRRKMDAPEPLKRSLSIKEARDQEYATMERQELQPHADHEQVNTLQAKELEVRVNKTNAIRPKFPRGPVRAQQRVTAVGRGDTQFQADVAAATDRCLPKNLQTHVQGQEKVDVMAQREAQGHSRPMALVAPESKEPVEEKEFAAFKAMRRFGQPRELPHAVTQQGIRPHPNSMELPSRLSTGNNLLREGLRACSPQPSTDDSSTDDIEDDFGQL